MSNEVAQALQRLRDAINRVERQNTKLASEIKMDQNKGLNTDINALEEQLAGLRATQASALKSSQTAPKPVVETAEQESVDDDSTVSINYVPQFKCPTCEEWFAENEYTSTDVWLWSGAPAGGDLNAEFWVEKTARVEIQSGWRCSSGCLNLGKFDSNLITPFWTCNECNEEYETKQEAINCCY